MGKKSQALIAAEEKIAELEAVIAKSKELENQRIEIVKDIYRGHLENTELVMKILVENVKLPEFIKTECEDIRNNCVKLRE